MIQIDKQLILQLLDKAVVNPRLRQSYDMRNSEDDGSQRLLYALKPGTKVDIHRHPNSNETFVCLCGKVVSVIYEEDSAVVDFPMGMDAQDVPNGKRLKESERYMLDPAVGNFGCVVPAGAWHTVEVLEPSVIYEAKDGKYGEDGSQSFAEFQGSGSKFQNSGSKFISRAGVQEKQGSEDSGASFSNSLGDLKKNIEYLIGMERQSGSMDAISPLYVSRMLNVPLEEVEKCMKEMGV